MTKNEAALHDYLIAQSQIAEGAKVLDYGLLTYHLDTAIDALEKACDYGWHDLRKNPDDLPTTENKTIEIQTKNKCVDVCIWNKKYGFRPWHMIDEIYVTEMYDPRKDVIAWREIEPFEEE